MAFLLAGKLVMAAVLMNIVFAEASEVEVENKNVIAVVNGNATFLCKASYPISICIFQLPGDTATIFLNENQGLTSDGYKYYGRGYNTGECGIYINNVQEKHNGKITCQINPPQGSAKMTPGEMILTVAFPPQKPIFSPPVLKGYDLDNVLHTGCVIRDGRPAANISWYLDDIPLVDGVSIPRINEKDNLLTVSQNFTKRLTINDSGRTLKCVASHIALREQDSVISAQINVYYKPIPKEDIKIYGIKINENAQINVTIQANPPPQIEWVVDGNHISDSQYLAESTGRFLASSPLPLGGNQFNATLLITSVERQDTEKEFKLNARNEKGETTYHVIITTLEEPEGFDLGVGGIVGIVVAVLLILIIVFMTIFAKATNRWCFGGGVLRTDIPDAADSEAPLPGEKGDGNLPDGAVNPSHEDYIPNGNGKTADIKSHPMEKPDTAV